MFALINLSWPQECTECIMYYTKYIVQQILINYVFFCKKR